MGAGAGAVERGWMKKKQCMLPSLTYVTWYSKLFSDIWLSWEEFFSLVKWFAIIMLINSTTCCMYQKVYMIQLFFLFGIKPFEVKNLKCDIFVEDVICWQQSVGMKHSDIVKGNLVSLVWWTRYQPLFFIKFKDIWLGIYFSIFSGQVSDSFALLSLADLANVNMMCPDISGHPNKQRENQFN